MRIGFGKEKVGRNTPGAIGLISELLSGQFADSNRFDMADVEGRLMLAVGKTAHDFLQAFQDMAASDVPVLFRTDGVTVSFCIADMHQPDVVVIRRPAVLRICTNSNYLGERDGNAEMSGKRHRLSADRGRGVAHEEAETCYGNGA